jgi:hypothetical protein
LSRKIEIILLLLFCLQVKAQTLADNITVPKTIFVAKPSGNDNIDRELILSALEEANKGDTIQFSSGTYLISKKIQIDIDEIILKGFPNETTIRGCNPENFTEHIYGILHCGGFELISQGVIVENFIFEYTWHGLMIGCCLPEEMRQLESGSNIKKEQFGGHIIQKNIFRFNSSGIRVIGINPHTVVIRNNIFQDNFHGITINGSNVWVQENRFYKSEPEKIPIDGTIDNAIGILPFHTMFSSGNIPELNEDCQNIEVIGNTIENIDNAIRISDSNLCKPIIMKDNIVRE